MNSSSNSTLNTCRIPMTLYVWYLFPYNVSMVVLYVLVIAVALIGNILVCAAVCINPNLRQNVASYFIVSLAVSDIATACFSMPFDLESFVTFGWWYHGEVLCIVWTTAYLITVPTSMWNLFILSIDRYKTLKNPWDRFKASPFMTKRRAVVAIAVLWILCMSYALLPEMGWRYQENTLYIPRNCLIAKCIFNVTPLNSILSGILNFWLPMLAMCFLYYKIYQIARTQYLRPTSALELRFTDTNSPAQKANGLRNKSKELINQTGRKDDFGSCKNGAARIKNMVQPGKTNVAVEIEAKHNRSGTMTEELEPPLDDNVTTNCDTLTDREKGHETTSDERQIEGVQVEIESPKRITSSGTADRQLEDDLQQEHTNDSIENENETSVKNDDDICRDLDDAGGKSEHELQKEKENSGQDDMDIENEKLNENSCGFDNKELEAEQKEENRRNGLFVQGKGTSDESTKVLPTLPPPYGENEEHDTVPTDGVNQEEHNIARTDEECRVESQTFEKENDPNGRVSPKPESMTAIEPVIVDVSNDDVIVAPLNEQDGISDMGVTTTEVSTRDESRGAANPGIVSMQEYLRKRITDEDRAKSGSRDSLESTCTLQSTLPDDRTSKNNISASKETVNSLFGSMEDLTKKRKIFVKNKKAARTIAIIVGAFLCCWLPRSTISIITNICQHKCFTTIQDLRIILYANHVSVLLGYISSAINPIVYSYRNVQFSKSYRKMIRKLFPCFRSIVRPN